MAERYYFFLTFKITKCLLLGISTPITTREVEWKKQRLQARYKDEDLFYARHKIQGILQSLEEASECIIK